MTQNRFRATHLFALLVVAVSLLHAVPSQAQDVITVGTVTANGPSADVPIYIRDTSGTTLGREQPAGSRIQSYSIRVTFSPAAAVSSVSFARAGITAGLTPSFENSPTTSNSITILNSFPESTNLIPFTLNAPGSGDQVAHLIFNLSPSAAPGSSITLTLDPTSSTQLLDDGGSTPTVENTGNGRLALVNGAINISSISLTISSGSRTVAIGNSAFMTAQTSANVSSATTVTLTSSDPSVATVPASVVIPAGLSSASFPVTGISVGSADITGTLPVASGGGTSSTSISVIEPPPACDFPDAPQISGPSAAEVGKAYAITWAVVSSATDYAIDESTDPNFGTVTTTTTTSNSASFTHAASNRYYYRVHARNLSNGCNTSSGLSNVISVLVSVAPVAQTRILPVVGSTPGNNAFFKTSVQLYNAKSSAISGKIVFHTQSTSGSATDPSLAFSIQAGKSLTYADLLPAMGIASGLGSADLIADAGSAFPVTLLRVFNDAGTAGTTGLAEEPMATTDALQSGDSGVLIAPADLRFRLNIGVRTLAQGASMTLTVRDKDGVIVKTTGTKTYGPTFFQQVGSAAILDGYVLAGGETIVIQVTAGSAFIYGATTDNTTQDPSVQFAKKVE